jgi:hypothetical protein
VLWVGQRQTVIGQFYQINKLVVEGGVQVWFADEALALGRRGGVGIKGRVVVLTLFQGQDSGSEGGTVRVKDGA